MITQLAIPRTLEWTHKRTRSMYATSASPHFINAKTLHGQEIAICGGSSPKRQLAGQGAITRGADPALALEWPLSSASHESTESTCRVAAWLHRRALIARPERNRRSCCSNIGRAGCSIGYKSGVRERSETSLGPQDCPVDPGGRPMFSPRIPQLGRTKQPDPH